MFQGEYQHGIDAKGRLILPARIREDLGTQFILTRGLDGCLFIYSLEEWKHFLEKLDALPTSSKNARRLKRYFIGSSVECEADKQGRFLIPQVLRNAASIVKDVTVLGVSDHIELWSSEEYNNYQSETEESIEDIASELDF
ncbi:MAG: division/cell wall cluster transcriptional repressor MraZ [Lachnospiraceae bacterium]|nr:division/cell wall cluster transcriptional repressor MraZ [Lachnospiraceae bacterium]